MPTGHHSPILIKAGTQPAFYFTQKFADLKESPIIILLDIFLTLYQIMVLY